ncbi:MAG: molecular chaperone [Alphaproteobacteria bacterium]|nr:molecular chaperone [Alphaproteobacteria bacterium]
MSDVISFPAPEDNLVQTFQLEISNLRGRIMRLGSVLDDILGPHAYPEIVENYVAEMASLALLLASMLKFEGGIFTLQAQGDGAVSMIVADVTSAGALRACAAFNKEKLEKLSNPTFKDLFGKGYLAFTVDQGDFGERYQGIVELSGNNLRECVDHYFDQSEQIKTALELAVKKEDGKWRAGGILLQHLPDHENIPQDVKPVNENWNRATILLETCTEEELLDERLDKNTLLMRLFHEEGVRIYTPKQVTKGCRCNMEKLLSILRTMPEEDKEHMLEDGKVTLTCEFCNKDFDYTRDDIFT